MKQWIIAVIVLATILIVPAACIAIDQLEGPGSDSVVFIEHKNNARGQLVFGNFTGQMLSGQEYAYDAENALLTCAEDRLLNGSLKVLVGTTRSLMQDAGNGLTNQLSGISALPSSAGGLKITEVLDDGTVTLYYNGTNIRLAPGERWEQISTENLETDDYRIKLVKSDIIRNHGKISVSSRKE